MVKRGPETFPRLGYLLPRLNTPTEQLAGGCGFQMHQYAEPSWTETIAEMAKDEQVARWEMPPSPRDMIA